MQLNIEDLIRDELNSVEGKNIMIGLSGGINSAAVLCYLVRHMARPKHLHLYYCHFEEHSPDTLKFVFDCVKFAFKQYDNMEFKYDHTKLSKPFEGDFSISSETVTFSMNYNSVLSFFEKSNMIPHPMVSPCTRILKINRIREYMIDNEIEVDLIGYVRSERRRIKNQMKRSKTNKSYPISNLTDEDCFSIVSKDIGWYPEIYSILWSDDRIKKGVERFKSLIPTKHLSFIKKCIKKGHGNNKSSRVYGHNNCLPCKNMQTWEFWITKILFPSYMDNAEKTAQKIGAHWGRNSNEWDSMESAPCDYCEI